MKMKLKKLRLKKSFTLDTQKLQSRSSQPKMEEQKVEIAEVTDKLYIGSYFDACQKNHLDRLGVTHVLNCASHRCKNQYPGHFVYKNLRINDTPTFEAIS